MNSQVLIELIRDSRNMLAVYKEQLEEHDAEPDDVLIASQVIADIDAVLAAPATIPDAGEGVCYVVAAGYDYEGYQVIKAFIDKDAAKEFTAACSAYKSTKKWPEGDTGYTDEWYEKDKIWEEGHPGGPSTACADSYFLFECKIVSALQADHSEDVRAMVVPDVDALKAEIASLSVRLENSDAVISSIQKIITRLNAASPNQ